MLRRIASELAEHAPFTAAGAVTGIVFIVIIVFAKVLPSFTSAGDVKDGLLKMALFTNLENTRIDEIEYNPIPILKLTTGELFDKEFLSRSQKGLLDVLKKEARTNGFKVLINDEFFV